MKSWPLVKQGKTYERFQHWSRLHEQPTPPQMQLHKLTSLPWLITSISTTEALLKQVWGEPRRGVQVMQRGDTRSRWRRQKDLDADSLSSLNESFQSKLEWRIEGLLFFRLENKTKFETPSLTQQTSSNQKAREYCMTLEKDLCRWCHAFFEWMLLICIWSIKPWGNGIH